MASIMGSRGQIVIEKAIRDALGLQPGSIAVQRVVGDHIELHFYPAEHRGSLRGALAALTAETIPPQGWDEARKQAWSEAIGKEWRDHETVP